MRSWIEQQTRYKPAFRADATRWALDSSRPADRLDAEIWVLLTHAEGDNNQCLALAEAVGLPHVVRRVDWPASNPTMDRDRLGDLLRDNEEAQRQRQALGLLAPWPRIVISCGHRSDPVAFWIKRQSRGFTRVVAIGRARESIGEYDLLVTAPPFMLPEHPNVIHLPISLARQGRAAGAGMAAEFTAAPQPWFTILLGGRVKQFVCGETALMETALRAQAAAERTGGSVVVATSRRTPPELLAAVESVIRSPCILRWSGSREPSPYVALLHQSAALFVTADSISMIGDGCGSGTPTYIIELPERIDVRRFSRRALYRLIRAISCGLRHVHLPSLAENVDRAQDWLHGKRILRYPRDLRSFHAKVYELRLAQPAAAFNPEVLPARRAANPLAGEVAVRAITSRCLSLLSAADARSTAGGRLLHPTSAARGRIVPAFLSTRR
ncbi:MAG TPA: ELM1/GtrOC1 family putative glycosyltransferase [Fimbriimonadaceae bacterium]|nr:ELM1/GtrOC1 family putative glycosyltransferase [Fimbriimonadaceae bacterium]